MAVVPAPLPSVTFANRYRGSAGVVPHRHDGSELVLVVRGRCRIHVAGAELAAGPGGMFVLPARVPHDQIDEGEVETLYVELAAPPRTFSDRARTIVVPAGSWAATWIRQLVDLEREQVPPAVRGGVAAALLAHLVHLEERAEVDRESHPGLVRALALAEADLVRDIRVEELAAAAGISASYLTALFRRRFGCGPLAWRQRQRLELACRLLRNGYLPVEEVAAACGYPDANYFARLFRQRYGCTPSRWRRRR